ncbi:lysozyme inhibitor LprI family protein [Escherichia coli]|uniref:lysozyme inhibitor LprI family protein n=1 Tax=Escherichia coli TaxID=562 RepID=UPI0002CC716F|nr:lysozyme inhibitor LprI family protein [Escherichia coli]ENC18355.1 hypothetical protein ECP02994387_2437 [Escherichia coli P0299438.7]
MNQKKVIKTIALYVALASTVSTAALDSHNSFQNIETVDDLLALPTSKLCLDGGPTSDDIRLMLLNGPLALPMYQNDPAMAHIMVNEQSETIKTRIREKGSSKPNASSRKLTKEMLGNESETCKRGAPTKDEIRAYINESKDPNIDIDKQLRAIPYEYRLMMEEGAKLKGLTLREVFIEDVASVSAKKWQETCLKMTKPVVNNSQKPKTLSTSVLTQKYNEVDSKLNKVWKDLSSESRKKLLPSQRTWIKHQAYCNQNIQCLIDMTNNRINELEAEK